MTDINSTFEAKSFSLEKTILSKTASWALLHHLMPKVRARRMLTAWSELLYSLRPFQGNFRSPADRSFIFGQTRRSTDFQ